MSALPDPTLTDAAAEAALRHRIAALGSAVVAYSGGVDSALVLAVAARELGSRVVAYTAVGPSFPPSERAQAAAVARLLGVRHVEEATDELQRPGYQQNAGDRCFHCRAELFGRAVPFARAAGLAAVLDGTQLDDLGEHRPGLRAAAAAGVLHPLVDAGFDKARVRRVARQLGLPVWDKPAAPCLASRLAVGTRVTPERLARVAQVEAHLHARGFQVVRVRVVERPGGDEARVEVGLDELPRLCAAEEWARTAAVAAEAGFVHVLADPAGYRRGSVARAEPGP